jgi:hypothetical protein
MGSPWVPMNELAAVQAHEQAQVDARAARYRARRRKRLERGEVTSGGKSGRKSRVLVTFGSGGCG